MVDPNQRGSIGRALLERERFAHVWQLVPITDDEPAQHSFYRALDFTDAAGEAPRDEVLNADSPDSGRLDSEPCRMAMRASSP